MSECNCARIGFELLRRHLAQLIHQPEESRELRLAEFGESGEIGKGRAGDGVMLCEEQSGILIQWLRAVAIDPDHGHEIVTLRLLLTLMLSVSG